MPVADKPKRGRKPKPVEDVQDMAVVSIKMTVAFRDWLNRFADSERTTVVQLLEKSVVEAAERREFSEAAPRRTVR